MQRLPAATVEAAAAAAAVASKLMESGEGGRDAEDSRYMRRVAVGGSVPWRVSCETCPASPVNRICSGLKVFRSDPRSARCRRW